MNYMNNAPFIKPMSLLPSMHTREPMQRHMWVELVVGSHRYSKGFSPGSPVFLSPQKPIVLNFTLGKCYYRDTFNLVSDRRVK